MNHRNASKHSYLSKTIFKHFGKSAAFVLIATCSMPVAAQTLDYGPYAGFGIGKGILGNDFEHPMASCIAGTQSDLPASQASVNVSIVYTNDEYSRAFHIDQSAKASYLGIAGGGDELHFGQEDSRATRAFDIIVEAYGEHPSQTLNNIDWDAKHAPLMKTPDSSTLANVRRECGDRYIETVFNESRLFAVLHVSSQQSSSLTQFSGKTNGSVDIDVVSASASLGGDLNIKSAHQSGAITVNIYSEGLGGIIPTAAAVGIASGDGLQDVATKLAAYLTSLPDKGQPVKYHLAALPGMDIGNLTDQTIIDDLTDMKGRYAESYGRLQNVKSLLGQDTRRAVFIEPDADTALRQRRTALNTYVIKTAQAHDSCRKAAASDVCESVISKLGDPPDPSEIELWPVLAPTMHVFQIAINGRFVSPGDVSLLLSKTGITLLEAAKALQADATDVDVVGVLMTPYLSHLDIPIMSPNLGVTLPTTVGSLVLRAQDLQFPQYWKDRTSNAVALHVAHADVKSPCPIKLVTGTNTLDDSCLTKVGRALRDAVLTQVAFESHPPFTSFGLNLGGITTDCFGTTTSVIYPPGPQFPVAFPVMLGSMSVEVVANAAGTTTSVRLFLYSGPGPLIKLFESSETHSVAAWSGLAASRLSTIPTAGLGITGTDPCSQHIK